jgi:hypothetical protein
VVTEVKEIVPNATEKAADVALRKGQPVVISTTPGKRIRGKISDALPQIKARAKRRYPGLLVLYEEGGGTRHVDSYQVRVAMFGFESVVIEVPNDPRQSPFAVGAKYGPGRRMTPDHSTSVSAVGILSAQGGETSLTVYHNPHAKILLPPELVARYGIPQYKLGDDVLGSIAQWVCITS